MQELSLDSNPKIRAKFAGQVYNISEPTVLQVQEFQEKSKSGPEGQPSFDQTIEFLSSLGLPKEILLKLTISKLNELTSVITGQLEKK